MAKLEKVIYSIERCICHVPDACRDCGYDNEPCPKCFEHLLRDAVDLLKAKELPDVKPEKLEERTTKWLDQMTAEERLEEIAEILDDWDGYRTAKGLGRLINEVWAYALYPVKAQEPGWIGVKERLPDEHDSIFVGRAQLSKYLWSKESDNVNVYVEFPDGTGRVTEGRLQDGKWWTRISPVLNPVVTHWKPLPEPPKEET